MTGALKYEWLRIRTIGSTYWFYGIAVGLTAVLTMFVIWGVNSAFPDDFSVVEATTWVITGLASGSLIPVLAAPFCACVGVLAMGHEYRYGTNKATLSAIPDRYAVLAAKLAIVSLWVLATVGTILAFNLLASALFLNIFEVSGETLRPLLLFVVYCLGFAFAGFGLAAIFRNQTGAMVAVLVWPLVVEPIINGVLTAMGEINEGFRELANILPASAGRRMMFDPYDIQAGFGGSFDTWGLGASALVYVIGVLVVLVGGAVLFIRRDA
jgi:ABC-type transport system involved in multi-copper enzyme maturation permease subunit